MAGGNVRVQEMSLKRAAMINAVSKYMVIVMNIVVAAILARILTPDDYGIIAVLTIFTTLFSRISDMGFGSAVIQFLDLEKKDVEDIHSFTGVVAGILAILFLILGYSISYFYGNDVYKPLCMILAVSVFFNCFNMIPNAVLLREKKFLSIGIRTIIVNGVGCVAAIICAFLGGKYYSLVLQSVIVAVLNFVWNNHTAGLRVHFPVCMKPVRRIWNYSIFQFLFSWVNYLEANLDQILIGGLMGSRSLAFYDRGYKLVSYPVGNIAGVITSVLHPILKDFQKNKDDLIKKYMEVQKVMSLVAAFIVPILFCASEELICIVYGNQWGMAVLVFQILSISVYPRMMMSTTGVLYCSAGNTKMLMVAGTINAVVTGIGIIAGIIGGSINTVALGVAIASWSNMFVTFMILMKKVMGQSIIGYFKEFAGDMFVMLGAIIGMARCPQWIEIQNMFLLLVVKVGFLTIIFGVYLILSGRYKILIRMIEHKKEN